MHHGIEKAFASLKCSMIILGMSKGSAVQDKVDFANVFAVALSCLAFMGEKEHAYCV